MANSDIKIYSGRYDSPDGETEEFCVITDPDFMVVVIEIVAAACAFSCHIF